MTQGDHIGNHARILAVGFIRRIAGQLFYAFGMHRIDLNQLDGFVCQIMKQRLRVGSGRFKTNNNLIQSLAIGKLPCLMIKCIKAFAARLKFKGLDLSAIRSSEIPIVGCLANINCDNQRIRIELFYFFWFNSFHGYTPLLIGSAKPTY